MLNNITILSIVSTLKKRFWKALGYSFGIVCLYLVISFLLPDVYQSSIIIYKNNHDQDQNEKQKDFNNFSIQNLNSGNTIINWVYSTDLLDQLIKEMDLYKHYKINQSDNDAYFNCFNKLAMNISVEITPYNAVKITVKDKDRFIAANIANAILTKMELLDKKMEAKKRQNLLLEYELLSHELSLEVKAQSDSVNKLISNISKLNSDISSPKHSLFLEKSISGLLYATNKYEQVSNDWLNIRKSQILASKFLEKTNLPSYNIVQYAIPDFENPFLGIRKLIYSFLILISSFWIIGCFYVLKDEGGFKLEEITPPSKQLYIVNENA